MSPKKSICIFVFAVHRALHNRSIGGPCFMAQVCAELQLSAPLSFGSVLLPHFLYTTTHHQYIFDVFDFIHCVCFFSTSSSSHFSLVPFSGKYFSIFVSRCRLTSQHCDFGVCRWCRWCVCARLYMQCQPLRHFLPLNFISHRISFYISAPLARPAHIYTCWWLGDGSWSHFLPHPYLFIPYRVPIPVE